jgi:negative regulator of flagellin synthesis FlgM
METTLTKTIERSPETHETVSGNAGTDMKVSNETINNPLRSSRGESLDKNRKAATAAEKSQAQAGDRVELSVNLREVDKLTATVASMPSANSEKIESIKSRIADGTYNVSGLDVAEKMLRSMGIDVSGGEDE